MMVITNIVFLDGNFFKKLGKFWKMSCIKVVLSLKVR